jgi:hypothetical protein
MLLNRCNRNFYKLKRKIAVSHGAVALQIVTGIIIN